MVSETLTVDVAAQLREWYDNPVAFTEQVILGRQMTRHERRVVEALCKVSVVPDPDAENLDIMEHLKPRATSIIRALGLHTHTGRRRRRKQGHLDTLRAFRQQPEYYPGLRYAHRWIRARCGVCRAAYATQTFISFLNPKDGRRMYVVEHEGVLDCGHATHFLYPMEWERDGRPVPCLSKGA